jgi:hypothetical protein
MEHIILDTRRNRVNLTGIESLGYSRFDWELAKRKEKDPDVKFEDILKEEMEQLDRRPVMYESPIEKIYGEMQSQKMRWIPVKERLPEIHNYSGKYLVTLGRGGVYIAMFTECDGEHWWTYDDVIAWMPLPDPYEESEGRA